MCIALYLPAYKKITESTLRNCWNENHDGAGFMYAHDNKLIVRKGYMRFKPFYAAFCEARLNYLDADFVLHFRFATHGEKNAQMTHPFVVNKDVAFVHNGILGGMPHHNKYSDTAKFAMRLMDKPVDFMDNVEECWDLEVMAVANRSKFIFMNSKGSVHIFNEGSGIWDNGIWYSNRDYKDEVKYDNPFSHYTWAGKPHQYYAFCELCGAIIDDGEGKYDRERNMIVCDDCCVMFKQ